MKSIYYNDELIGCSLSNIVNAYDSTSTYDLGDIVIYNSTIYKCTTAISIAEAFDMTRWTPVVLADELSSKPGALTFDSAPTENSTNPVTSGGVKTALDLKANQSDVYEMIEETGLAILGNFAPMEETIATSNHAIGDLFVLDGVLRKATSAIAANETITSSNCASTSIAELFSSIVDANSISY